MKPRGAGRKIKTMGMMPRLGAIQWCRLRRDLPSRSLAPAMGTNRERLALAQHYYFFPTAEPQVERYDGYSS
jgi:hypothetical protein